MTVGTLDDPLNLFGLQTIKQVYLFIDKSGFSYWTYIIQCTYGIYIYYNMDNRSVIIGTTEDIISLRQ